MSYRDGHFHFKCASILIPDKFWPLNRPTSFTGVTWKYKKSLSYTIKQSKCAFLQQPQRNCWKIVTIKCWNFENTLPIQQRNYLNVFPVGLKYIHNYNLLCLRNKYFLMNLTIWKAFYQLELLIKTIYNKHFNIDKIKGKKQIRYHWNYKLSEEPLPTIIRLNWRWT